MRSTSATSLMLNLPNDALSQIALSLPAVKSNKPWRDVNSLATTCKDLYRWKKSKVDKDVETEWKRMRNEVAKTTGWRDSLEKILSDFEDPSRRLFREPVLRKITKAPEPSTNLKPKTSAYDFNASLYINRESVSLYEIRQCLILCREEKLKKAKKIQIAAKLPSFLSQLKSIDRQNALRMMFKLLDADKNLARTLKVNSFFKKIEKSLGDDQQSKILLELKLYYRKLLSYAPDMNLVGFGLSFIPDEKRWNWVLRNVPEFLDTTFGMRVLLKDSVCQPQLTNYLKNSFFECTNNFDRLRVCKTISKIYPSLDKYEDGKDLSKLAVKWVLKAPLCINPKSDHLKKKYVAVLLNYLPHIQKFFGKKQKKLLLNNFYKAIKHAIKAKAFDQATSLLIAMAKDDINLFEDLSSVSYWLTDQEVLKLMLAHTHELRGSDNRDKFVFILRGVARHHLKSDLTFFDEFMKSADNILKNGSNSERNEYQGDGSTATKS